MTKDEILERYLNTVYFGNGAYGVQAAAETYFGKSVGELDWPRRRCSPAMIRDPRDYDPFTHPDARDRAAPHRAAAAGRDGRPHAGRGRPVRVHAAADRAVAGRRAAEGLLRREVKQQLLDDPR